MTRAASGADLANDGQNHIFGRHAVGKGAINGDAHVFGWFLNERLRCQNMFNLRRSNAKGQRAKCPMGCGVRITTNNGHARKGKALFRPNDMNDTLPDIIHRKIRNAEISRIFFQGFDLDTAFFIFNANRTVGCWDVMIGNGKRAVRGAHSAAIIAKPFKRLWAGHFMNQMPINIDQACAIFLLMHKMCIPDLIKQSFWSRHIILLIAAGEEVISKPVWQFKKMTPRDRLLFQRYEPLYRYGHANNIAWHDEHDHDALPLHRQPVAHVLGIRARRLHHRKSSER